MFAIAAMSRNGIIGNGNSIPWRIPEEFKWFRRKTLGGVVIMGRRTFESLPKPLEGRVNVVLTRHPEQLLASPRFQERFGDALGSAPRGAPGAEQLAPPRLPGTEVRVFRDLDALLRAGLTGQAWLCGGAEIYERFLPECSELFLSVIDRDVEGDTRFPRFDHLFDETGVVAEFAEFKVHHYVRNGARATPPAGEAGGPEPRKRAPSGSVDPD